MKGESVEEWWHEAGDGEHIVCDVCPRACKLLPGKRGFCFVRQNRDGRIVSTTYGRSTGFCIDPIEKKPLSQFYPGTPVLSFGTAGCNLGCRFCQNWTSSRSRDVDAGCEVADPETIARAAAELNCRSVAYTYNDPIVWIEYAIDTARACRAAGVKNVAVTSGYIQAAARKAFYENMDAANVDLKGFSEEFYRDYTGGQLEPVLDTLRWLARETNVWVEITNLVVPQANDSPDEIERMCDWIIEELGPDVPLHFSAFHPDFKVTDRGPTPLQTLLRAHDIARRAGLHYVYTGNVRDREHQCTYCPGCGQMVIERDGYVLGAVELDKGNCRHCGHPIAGCWDETPGDWGSKRMPVRIAAYAAQPTETRKTTSTEEPNVSSPDTPQDSTPQDSTIEPVLTEEQEARIFRAAGRRVAAAVTSTPPENMKEVLADTAEAPLYGTFVSLKRGGQLRSCCGYMGNAMPLAESLDRSSVRAAKEDPRFPPISPSELEHLDMEVWLLWGLKQMTARGEDRVKEVTIGRNGLQIARGAQRGLLLPGVAIDHQFDARGFLGQVCLKAGLPTDAWLADDTQVWTFDGRAISGRLDPDDVAKATEQAFGGVAIPGAPTRGEVAALADFARGNLIALLQGATPNFYMTGGFDGTVNGVAMSVGEPGSEPWVEESQISIRSGIPLQATLFNLIRSAAAGLRSRGVEVETLQTAPIGLTVFLDPAMHGDAADADLAGVDPQQRAVVLLASSGSAWVYDPNKTPQQLLDQAVEDAGVVDLQRSRVCSAAVVTTQERATMANVPQAQSGSSVRPAAVAGAFYPASPQEVDEALDGMLPKRRKRPKAWPAVMVPHAGWSYSGKLAAETLSRVKIPNQIIVLSPKHRPGGLEWAVAPHDRWALPHGEVESDPELARHLAQSIAGLELDAAAHQQEHSIEVLLPIISRLAPKAKVVGITVGAGELTALLRFGDELAEAVRKISPRPLFVISSDMNHFADEATTQRLDRIALDAMETCDPQKLYETVRGNQISMCGIFSAVIVMEALKCLKSLKRCELVGYATSAETSGDTERVVGYAGMLLG